MASLYSRATPVQKKLLKIIEGSVKNTFDAHAHQPDYPKEKFARSVAKRAVGTLSAQMPEVLALGAATPGVTQD